MKKMSLDLDTIRVDSFSATPEAAEEAGTVEANDASFAYSCGNTYCGSCPSCATNCHTCDPTCIGNTCWDSCPFCD